MGFTELTPLTGRFTSFLFSFFLFAQNVITGTCFSWAWVGVFHVVCECVTLAEFNVNSPAAPRFPLTGIHPPVGTPLDTAPKAWFTLTKYDKWLESVSSSYFHSCKYSQTTEAPLNGIYCLSAYIWVNAYPAGWNEYSYALKAHIHHWMCNLACISAAP